MGFVISQPCSPAGTLFHVCIVYVALDTTTQQRAFDRVGLARALLYQIVFDQEFECLAQANAHQLIQLVGKLVSLVTLYIGARLVIEGKLSVGQFVAFNMMAQHIAAPVLRLAQLWQDFQQVGISMSRLGDILNTRTELPQSRQALPAVSGNGSAPALVEKLRAGYHAYPVSFAMFLRLVPFFPFGGVTVALAWLRCPLWLFALATVTGGSVMIAFETALGAGLTETIAREGQVSLGLFSHKRVIVLLLGMAVLALVPVVLGQLRRIGKKEGKGD